MKSYRGPLILILTMLLVGCSSAPLQYSGNHIQAADLAFVIPGQTTRAEFEARLGRPWMHYADLNLSVYYWEVVRRRFYQHMTYGVTGGEQTPFGPSVRIELLCVAYDENARILKWAIMAQPENRSTKEVAAAWLASVLKDTRP